YTFTTVGAFGVVAWLGNRGDERLLIDDWAGLASRYPAPALAMTIFMLSLGGIPPTAGFFGKFYLFRAALARPGLVWLVVWVVVLGCQNSFARVYFSRGVEGGFSSGGGGRGPQPFRPTAMNAALWIAALATLALGIAPGWLIDFATSAVQK